MSNESLVNSNTLETVKCYLLKLQQEICDFIEAIDSSAHFVTDNWQHVTGGGGIARILEGGDIIEKAGVNFSHVYGDNLPIAATLNRPHLINRAFHAMGVSVVVHPYNPYMPTSHANIRFIVVEAESAAPDWWFGGGFDLTPYYGFMEDCKHWHQMAQRACLPYGHDVYPRFKKWCDDYFYLKHRNEPRGIGGLFFDDLNEWGFAQCFSFIQNIGDHYIKAYRPILIKRKTEKFSASEKAFQAYRRGRYVEFNLLYDRGTLFGIQSGGRTESILMSLPPAVSWKYNWVPPPGSREAELYEQFLQIKAWI